jgi:muramoyltetrapeptide carboxypeptidase
MNGRLSWGGGAARWPNRLEPGATLGLFAPAGPFDEQKLERGLETARSWGFTVKAPRGLFRSAHKYLAGTDRERLALMTALMEDESVAGLWAARGGYGCLRLLPALAERWADWPPKPIIGFSDLTALHLARLKCAGVIGCHGPMGVSLAQADRISREDLKASLLAPNRRAAWAFTEADILKKGAAAGPLIGGNMCLIVSLLAGPWRPDFEGAILMLEEVGEPAYRLDRLLTTLRQSPLWRQAGGLVFGGFARCGPPMAVKRLLREAADDFDGPVLCRAPFGHGRLNRFFPIGAPAVLKAG